MRENTLYLQKSIRSKLIEGWFLPGYLQLVRIRPIEEIYFHVEWYLRRIAPNLETLRRRGK